LQKEAGNVSRAAGEQQSPEFTACGMRSTRRLETRRDGLLHRAGGSEPVKSQRKSLHELASDIHKGKWICCWFLGGILFTTRRATGHFSDFEQKLKKVHTVVHLSSHYNETSDFRAGTFRKRISSKHGAMRAPLTPYKRHSPLIAPLHQAHSAFELLAAFTDKPGVTFLRCGSRQVKSILGGGDTEKNCAKRLNDA